MKIAICGTMKFSREMVDVAEKLKEYGHEPILPKLMPDLRDFHEIRDVEGKEEEFYEYKRNALKEHFDKIKNADAILVLNYDNDNIKNNVGGNTLIEIGVAFERNKKIFLLNPIPEGLTYTEELQAIKPIVLNGDLEKMR